jgi:hypothetical protein
MSSGNGKRVWCACTFFLLCPIIAFAQSSVATATLNGTITDPTGAAITKAKVTARDVDTGFVRQTVTTDAGLYSLTDLPVGVYELTVQPCETTSASQWELFPP